MNTTTTTTTSEAKPAWILAREASATCPRCRQARETFAAKHPTLRPTTYTDHGDDWCAIQSVETFGPSTYGHPRAFVQIRAEGGAS